MRYLGFLGALCLIVNVSYAATPPLPSDTEILNGTGSDAVESLPPVNIKPGQMSVPIPSQITQPTKPSAFAKQSDQFNEKLLKEAQELAHSTDKPKLHGMKIGNIDLSGRICTGCQYSLHQGYLTKVISPEDGPWDISNEYTAFIDGATLVKIDPSLKSSDVQANIDSLSKLAESEASTSATPTPVEIPNPYNLVKDGLEDFPIWNLLLLVIVGLLVAFSIPALKKLYSRQ